ncbi:MAG: cold-shock protein [Luteibacter sp.]
MAAGTVKWFNAAKGFGFIAQSDGGQDVFLHRSALPKGTITLDEGRKVAFDLVQGRLGLAAANVTFV